MKEVLAANGVKILVDFLTLAHLHTSRATVPLQVEECIRSTVHKEITLGVRVNTEFISFKTKMIEASVEQARESEKEWYFGNVDKERRGPHSFGEVSIYTEQSWTCMSLFTCTKPCAV